ncbi:MAG: adenosine deaminase [Planctomycetes bacterium]|nr:adenosine deaminase [Planctomycetota bacterium]
MSRQAQELRARLRALPKTELHCHLEAAARLETLWDLHRAAGETLHASLGEFQQRVVLPEGAAPGFPAFLGRFSMLRFCYGGTAGLERIAREVVADFAADGVVHLELRLNPVFWARRLTRAATLVQLVPGEETIAGPLPSAAAIAQAVQAIVRGAQAEAARCKISVGFILSFGRHVEAPANAAAAQLFEEPVGRAFSAVDVAGDEALPLQPVLPFVESGRKAGLAVTLHAGEDPRAEAPGANGVREAVEQYHAARIGHGVRAVESPAVLKLLADRKIALEVCLTSNVQTQAARSYSEHPLRQLLAAGVPATLNTDDPLISGITLTEEYARAHERCGLPLHALRDLAVQGAAAAFLPAAERTKLVARVSEAWDAFLANMQAT